MTQTFKMRTNKGAKKTTGKPPSGPTLPPLLGSDTNPASSDPVLVDLDPTPLSQKRAAEIQQEELDNLAWEGIKVAS